MNEEDIFLQALDINSPSQRAEFLDEACKGDSMLRKCVDGLLDAHDGIGTFLEKPFLETPIPQLTDTLAPGRQGAEPGPEQRHTAADTCLRHHR